MQSCISLFPQTSENKKEEFELGISAIESKEQQTKLDFKDAAVQSSPDSQEVAVQSSPDSQEVAVQTNSETTTVEIAGRPTARFV